LIAHNYYGSAAPSGENHVFEAERALLSSKGHEVEVFIRHSDQLRKRGIFGTVQGALVSPWNPWVAEAFRREVLRFRPEVVHVHNTFPILSPAIFSAIGHHAPSVLTLHNYRIFCPAAIPMRNGKVCTECLDRHSAWPSLKYGCYRGSRAATIPLAVSVELHRKIGTWTNNVDAFIALTEFQRQVMTDAGLPSEKVHVKPNFYAGRPVVVEWSKRENYVVFAGRLSPEKGIETLVQAWLKWGSDAPELRIVGDGPLREAARRMMLAYPETRIRLLGQLPAATTQMQIANANLLILPSEWYEGFPIAIMEAFAFGTPAAVSNIGSLASIVKHGVNGIIFPPGNAEALLREVRNVWMKARELEQLSKGARLAFEESYTQDSNYHRLIQIYERAETTHRARWVHSASST
jgi:glycosyltransferase involved in cell wall biosynthesis